MKKESSSPLSPDQYARLARLSALPDDDIDTSDSPAVLDWTGAKRGLFYTGAAASDQTAVSLDAKVVDWFEGNAASDEDFESNINRVLSEHIAEQIRKAS